MGGSAYVMWPNLVKPMFEVWNLKYQQRGACRFSAMIWWFSSFSERISLPVWRLSVSSWVLGECWCVWFLVVRKKDVVLEYG